MNIAFWSSNKGSGVTSNIAAFSIAGVYGFPARIALLDNHIEGNNLARTLLNSRWCGLLREGSIGLYTGGNSESYVREMSVRMNRRVINNSMLEIIQDKLYYYCYSCNLRREYYEYKFNEDLLPMLEYVSDSRSICLIDTDNSHNLSTKVILDIADIVVVNLNQDKQEADIFFEEYSSLVSKSVFILSSYQRNKKVTPQYLVKRHGISRDRILVIPYSCNFRCAYEEGRMVEFITSNYNCDRKSENYSFMYELRKSVKKLFSIASMLDGYAGYLITGIDKSGYKVRREEYLY